MTTGITIRAKARFQSRRTARRPAAETTAEAPQGRIPRVARLLALAHRFEKLIADGEVRDYAELARLGHVTRARVTQIMNLLNLAPDVQEELISSSPIVAGSDWVTERQLREVSSELIWARQRVLWKRFLDSLIRSTRR